MTLFQAQDEVLKILTNEIDDFYLAGGTALAKFYFRHRESYDLDFFTQKFSALRVAEIAKTLSEKTGKAVTLKRASRGKKTTPIRTYDMVLGKKEIPLKIDFVKDVLPLLKPFIRRNGINVLSLEDIFLRKIYAVSGIADSIGRIGQARFRGGRQEAKDLYDLYALSTTFQNLSQFMAQNCEATMKEGIVNWFHRFNRSKMKLELTEVNTHNVIEFVDIDRHFKKEVDRLIAGMV